MENNHKKILIIAVIASIITSSIIGGVVGFWAGSVSPSGTDLLNLIKNGLKGGIIVSSQPDFTGGGEKVIKVEEESAVISAVEKVSPAVVSIIITKDLPIIEQYFANPGSDFFRQFFGEEFDDFFGFGIPQYRQKGTQKREVGGGSGFIISSDGYVVTNKHVVSDEEAEYTVLMNNGNKYSAQVLARDPVNDLAIFRVDAKGLPTLELGDSSNLKVGQTVIAIGNALAFPAWLAPLSLAELE